jgi:hypothetical protein
MSDAVNLPLVMLQKAQNAAEAAAAAANLFESEAGHRLSAIEARLSSVEGRLTNIAAQQSAHNLALMRIADAQAEHKAQLDRIEVMLTAISQKPRA